MASAARGEPVSLGAYLALDDSVLLTTFSQWAESVCSRFGYAVRFLNIGTEAPGLGSPTQMAVFTRSA